MFWVLIKYVLHFSLGFVELIPMSTPGMVHNVQKPRIWNQILVDGLEHFLFFHILRTIIPTELNFIFFRGVGIPPIPLVGMGLDSLICGYESMGLPGF